MNKTIVTIIVLVVLAPVLLLGCQAEQTSTTPPAASSTIPPSPAATPKTVALEISTAEFMEQNHIAKDIELVGPGSLKVSLGSNPTTGFKWGESAVISDSGVIAQKSHEYVPPETGPTPVMGAAGKEVWVFNSLKAGASTISLSYGRPWEGGEKDTWTLVLNVTVK